MDYLDFDLLIERAGEKYKARVLGSPAGQAAIEFSSPFSELELENFILKVGRPRRWAGRQESPEIKAAKSLGGRLFNAVFSGEVWSCLRSSLDETARQGVGLRLRLRLADVPELADIPWEYLYNPSIDRFFSLSVDTPLVRYLDLPERIRPLGIEPPLRVLVMISSPCDYPSLDVEGEWAKLKVALDDLKHRGLVVLDRLEHATLSALQKQLRQEAYHIFHFIGHGSFDKQLQDGVLIMEDENQQSRLVSGQNLGRVLHDERTLRLVLLDACEGARSSRIDPFAGTAQSLVQQGILAVIAMQFEVTDETARTFAHQFYDALADGYPVDAALSEARKAIFAKGNTVEWGTPVLYTRSPDGSIFDITTDVEVMPKSKRERDAEARSIAQAKQIERDALSLEGCADVEAIRKIHRSLIVDEMADWVSTLLRRFSRVSQDVDAALLQESAYNQRLALRGVEERLDSLWMDLSRSSEHYAERFLPIAAHWRQIVANNIRELAETVERRQEIDNPYVVGPPLTVQQEIFIGRTDVSARIEQLLLDRRCPPLLLYGQRRVGKTSLLNNLGRLLPTTIVPFFVDLQGPASASGDSASASFLYNITRGIISSALRHRNLNLFPITLGELAHDPFTRFDEWLDGVEQALGQSIALLALDEFEALDSAITRGRFDADDILGMLRHVIQHRPRFKVLLAGSHTLDEFQRWASYLINAQVVHISYLKENEACQLIERPVKDFALRYEPDAKQRVLDLTRGHPFLVQLLCAEIVALKNEQEIAIRRLARLSDVEAAVPEALNHGVMFFADIKNNQVDAGLAVLRFIATKGEGAIVSRETLTHKFPDELARTLSKLVLRELIEPVGDGYRFQVELIRRWFTQEVK